MEILQTLEKSHAGGWFPWGFLPAPDGLILWSVPDACKDVDLDALVEALRPVGTFRKVGKVFRREGDSAVGLLQIGDDVDHALIPRQVRLAGGVWRVLAKPATREAQFRERLLQFLEEEGRTLEDVARILEKSPPPLRPPKPKEPRVRRRVPQMAPPPPRLVVGTYDSSNASDSDGDSEAPGEEAGPGRGRRARGMPVSYLGSKFLGSDAESGDDEALVEAFLRRREGPAQPARRRAHAPGPVSEDSPGLQPSKGDRWREYVSQVSWGKLRRRVKGWAPGAGVGEAQQASARVERPGSASLGHNVGRAGDGLLPEARPRRWRPRINWASFRLLRRREAAATAQGAEAAAAQEAAAIAQGAEAVDNQGAEAAAAQGAAAIAQGAEAAAAQGAAAIAQGAEAAAAQGAAALAQGAEAADNQGAGAAADQGAAAVGTAAQGTEAPAVQAAGAASDGAEARAGQRAEAPAEAEAFAAQGAPGATPGGGARKQAKTVRFQTPGRFWWLRRRRRSFWHTPRLPTALPKRAPRAGEARSLWVLRAEARAAAEQEEQEDLL